MNVGASGRKSVLRLVRSAANRLSEGERLARRAMRYTSATAPSASGSTLSRTIVNEKPKSQIHAAPHQTWIPSIAVGQPL
jgi:hypothetical protein